MLEQERSFVCRDYPRTKRTSFSGNNIHKYGPNARNSLKAAVGGIPTGCYFVNKGRFVSDEAYEAAEISAESTHKNNFKA